MKFFHVSNWLRIISNTKHHSLPHSKTLSRALKIRPLAEYFLMNLEVFGNVIKHFLNV